VFFNVVYLFVKIYGKRQISWWIEKKQKPEYTQVFAYLHLC